MATAASVKALADAASTAIAGGNWNTALAKALQAQAELSAIPDSGITDATNLKWDRRAIESLIANIRRQQALSLGMQQTKISYAKPEES